MRADEARTSRNQASKSQLKTILKNAHSAKKYEVIAEAYSALDRAVKKNLIHRNFANRQKSQLGKLIKPTKLENAAAAAKKTAKKAVSSAKPTQTKKTKKQAKR